MKYKLLSLIFIFILCLPILSLQAQDDVITFDFERGSGASANFWQVYFTNPDGERIFEDGIDLPLIDTINQAQNTLDIAAFEWNNPALTQAVIDAHARGVQIRMVVDNEHTLEDDDTTIEDVIEAGIPVIDDDRSALMHNKFMIIDGFIVVTGSMNFTLNGAYRNNNNLLILRSRRLAEIYTAEFEEMFIDGEFGDNNSEINGTSFTLDGIPITVAFSPEDDVVPTLIDLVRQAETSIRFMTFSFTRDDVGLALSEMAGQGVSIEGIFENTGSETRFSEMPFLYCSGLDVRQDGNPGILHHKVFIIDDHTVMSGSFNISDNATESNDENMIIIQDPLLVQQYFAEFERMQSIAEAPDDLDCADFELISPVPTETVTLYTTGNVNARSCPQANNSCPVQQTLSANTPVEAIQQVEGSAVGADTTWWEVEYNGEILYIHNSLLSETQIQVQQVAPTTDTGGTGSTDSTGGTTTTEQNTSPDPAPASQWTCSGDQYNCGDFSTCTEVTSYFTACPGDPSRLDSDNDGIPCESLCGG